MSRRAFAEALAAGVQHVCSLSFPEARAALASPYLLSGDVVVDGNSVHWTASAIQESVRPDVGQVVEFIIAAIDSSQCMSFVVYVPERLGSLNVEVVDDPAVIEEMRAIVKNKEY
jgi:hypothetical protein